MKEQDSKKFTEILRNAFSVSEDTASNRVIRTRLQDDGMR